MTTTPSNRSIHDHTNLSETAQTDTIQPEPLQTEPLQTESVQTTEQPVAPILVRPAEACDAPAVCEILVEAFPTLYEWTFGKLPRAEMVALLHHLYEAGCLDLSTTRIAHQGGPVIGIALLHLRGRVGHGPVRRYGRTIFRQLNLFSGLRAFFGGIMTNLMLSSRIPYADDLVYIEALAVASSERNRGVGQALLNDAIQWAGEQRRPRLALHVLQRNEGARRLYTRFGFVLTPPEPLAAPPDSKRGQWVSLLMMRDP